MLNVLALATLSIAFLQTGTESIGTAQVGGKEIPIVLPLTPASVSIPADAAHVDFGGAKYLLLPDGTIGRRYVDDGLWGDVKQLYGRSSARPERLTWKVKVFILTRGEILETGTDGILRVRRSTLEQRQIDDIYASLARLKAMVEGYSEGRLNVSFDVTIDDDPIRIASTRPGPLFDEEFLETEFGPRINTFKFDTEDKVDRGPFDTTFVVNAALTKGAHAVLPGNRPVSLVSYYTNRFADLDGGLSAALYAEWIWQLAEDAKRQGYRVTADGDRTDPRDPRFGFADPGAFMSPSMWTSVASHQDPPDPTFVSRWWRPESGDPKPWPEVKVDPWGLLPDISPQESQPVWKTGALIEPQGNDGFRVRLDAAELFASATGASVLGFCSSFPGQSLIFQAGSLGGGTATAERLKLEVKGSLAWWGQPKMPAQPSINLSPTAWGNFEAKLMQDPARGAAVQVTESKAVRLGSAKIADGGGEPMFDPAATPILEFWVKPTVIESYEVRVLDRHGETIGSVVVGQPPRIPREAEKDEMIATRFLPIKVGEWQKATIDLRLPKSDRMPWEIVVAPPPFNTYFERQVGGPTAVSFAGFAARAASVDDDHTTLTTEQALSEVEQRALQAAKVQEPASEADKAMLFELLKDQKELVRLNAAAALNRVKAPDTVPLLIDQSKSASPQIAQMAIDALAFQGTDAAWSSILESVVKGPFDFNRQYATRQMGNKGDGMVANLITTMMTSRSWHGRREGALALPKMPGKETPLLLISLLQEIEPGVRLAVTRGADPSVELVNRRLLWAAVNDPSEEVRAESFLTLTRSSMADYKAEGYKGVRNDAKAIRLRLLEAFREKPSEDQRGALRLAVVDASAEVRAAALRAFAKLPNPVEAAEIENSFVDKDPRVQAALVELAKAKGIKLSDAALQNLRSSVDKNVAALARSLGG